MTYSPAPFVAGEEFNDHQNEILDADGRCVAVVWVRRAPGGATARDQFKDDPMGIANWRLLTASPKLLQALKAMIPANEAARRAMLKIGMTDRMIENALAAVAFAEKG